MNSTPSDRSPLEPCVTPTQLREAMDALVEAAETRRSVCESVAKSEAVNLLIAESYEHTARVLSDIVRILDRDQTVLRPVAPAPLAPVPSAAPRIAEQPTCALCGSANVSADAAARWDMDGQDWEVSNVFDQGYGCDDCERYDIDLVWIKVLPVESEHGERT